MKFLKEAKKSEKIIIGFSAISLVIFASLGVWFVYGQQILTAIEENIEVAGNMSVGAGAEISGVIRGYAVPSEINWTNATHNGGFGGYKEMNDWIQNNGCAGYHVCDAIEVVRYQQHRGPININNSWYNAGRGHAGVTGNQHMCNAWTNNSSGIHGPVFQGNYGGGSRPSWNTCNVANRVLCCKY